MEDPYHLIRALEVILSLNDKVLKDNGLEKAKELASRGLSRYNTQTTETEESSKKCPCICSKQSSRNFQSKNM